MRTQSAMPSRPPSWRACGTPGTRRSRGIGCASTAGSRSRLRSRRGCSAAPASSALFQSGSPAWWPAIT